MGQRNGTKKWDKEMEQGRDKMGQKLDKNEIKMALKWNENRTRK